MPGDRSVTAPNGILMPSGSVAYWFSSGEGSADVTAGSMMTASWMLRPSSRDSALVISARSRFSSWSLANSFGVAISAVFSTRPSGLVSWSQAR